MRFAERAIEALKKNGWRKPNPKNRVPDEVEQAILELALEFPAFGRVRIASKMAGGVSIPPARVWCMWQRRDLETMKKRLKALEAKVAEDCPC